MNNRQRKILWFLFALILISVVVPPWRSYQIAKDYLPEETIYRLVFLGAPQTTTISHYRGFRIDSTRLILEWGCLILLGGLATLALAGVQSELSDDDVGSKARKENRKMRRMIIWKSWKRIQVWFAGIIFLIACGFLPYLLLWRNGVTPLGYFILSTAPNTESAIRSDIMNFPPYIVIEYRPKRQYEILRDSLDSKIKQAQIKHDEEWSSNFKGEHKTSPDPALRATHRTSISDSSETPIGWAMRMAAQNSKPSKEAPDSVGNPQNAGKDDDWATTATPWSGPGSEQQAAQTKPATISQNDLNDATTELLRMQDAGRAGTTTYGGPWGVGPNPYPSNPIVDSIRYVRNAQIYNDSIAFVNDNDSLLHEDSILYARMATALNASVSIDPFPASIQLTLATLFLLFGLWNRKSSKGRVSV